MDIRMQQGKPAYSHFVTVVGPGKTIYIAGRHATPKATSWARATCGPRSSRPSRTSTPASRPPARLGHVVRTNTFVTDYQEFAQCSDVRMRYFGAATPTSTTIEISGLAQPDAMVEMIEAVD
jgi:hypothetical protein